MVFGAGDIRLRRQFIDNEDTDEDHKRREGARLQSLIAYAEAQGCRRRALLAYFGEDPGRDCGNCDNCLNPVELRDGQDDAEDVFEAILETGGRYGQAHIIDVLRGVETEKVVKARHDRLHCFGKGERYSKPQWQGIVRQMLSAGFLEIDTGGYSSLVITSRGNELSRGKERFSYRADTLTAGRTSRARRETRTPAGPAPDLSSQDNALLDALKRERLSIAKERGVPAYVVFPDKTLIDMAMLRPANLDEFSQVKGVGQAKLNNFGDAFLAVIRQN